MRIVGVLRSSTQSIIDSFSGIDFKKRKFTVFSSESIFLIYDEDSIENSYCEIIDTKDRLLIGRVFNKITYEPITKEEFLEQTPESLVKNFWGSYLLFEKDNKTNDFIILRDPVGQFPLFYTKTSSGDIYFSSEINLLLKVKNEKPSFNWNFFCAYILHSFITTIDTPFNLIYELPYGCLLKVNKIKESMDIEIIWNPLDYIHNSIDEEEFRTQVVNRLSHIIKVWTKSSKQIILEFSGGIDSTGLLYIINRVLRKDQTFKAVHMFHSDISASDERKHARKIAKKLKINLTESNVSECLPFESFDLKMTPNLPNSSINNLKYLTEMHRELDTVEGAIYINGHGGDNLFMTSPPLETLCDYLIEKGRQGFWIKLKEIATIYRKSFISILKYVIPPLFRYSIGAKYKYNFFYANKYKMMTWYKKKLFKLEKKVKYHPFFQRYNSKKITPGKFQLINAIYDGIASISSDLNHPHLGKTFYPFLTQPMIELVLSFPTYNSYKGQYPRYQYRKAIAQVFKTNAVWRLDKGEISGVIQLGLEKNKKKIVDTLVNGKFNSLDIIETKALMENIKNALKVESDLGSIMNLICVEKFIQLWDENFV